MTRLNVLSIEKREVDDTGGEEEDGRMKSGQYNKDVGPYTSVPV